MKAEHSFTPTNVYPGPIPQAAEAKVEVEPDLDESDSRDYDDEADQPHNLYGTVRTV